MAQKKDEYFQQNYSFEDVDYYYIYELFELEFFHHHYHPLFELLKVEIYFSLFFSLNFIIVNWKEYIITNSKIL